MALGLGNKSDPLSGTSMGGLTILSTVDPKKWERGHAGTAYYAPVADRPNPQLLTECMVQKLAIEKLSSGDLAATGVHLLHNGEEKLLKSKKEVLLCAGVFQSPQLFELSGIGSAGVLEAQDIP